MSRLQIQTPSWATPLLEPARYKGVWGGRGSGKSHFFVDQGIEDGLRIPGDYGEGMRFACIREVQKDLRHSAKTLFEKKLQKLGLGEAQGFKVWREVIETPGDGLITFTGMTDHTADSVKSMEGFHRAWVEEAQSLSERSLTLLIPTIRAEGKDWRGWDWFSELWFSWNPERPTDAVDRFLRSDAKPDNAVVVQANWNQNPWFPKVLDQERKRCLEKEPEKYSHIWEGDYARVWEGAYFARHLIEAEQQERIGVINADPIMSKITWWDIGSASDKADATAIWGGQSIVEELRMLDYYEAVGQPLEAHIHWLKSNGYNPGEALVVLPHDGNKSDTVYSTTVAGALRQAGYQVLVVPNQGKGAALRRIETARRLFPQVRFDRDGTDAGREALGWYHEKKDEKRNIGLGPNHDWSSHGADAFGLACIWKEQYGKQQKRKPLRRNVGGVV